MPPKTVCPNCGAAYALRDEMIGKKVRCKKCEQAFVAEARPGPSSDGVRAQPPPAESIPVVPVVDEPPLDVLLADRPAPERKASSATPVLLVVGGVLAGLFLLCGGSAVLVYWRVARAVEEVQNEFGKQFPPGKPGGPAGPFGAVQPLAPGEPPPNPGYRPPANLDEAAAGLTDGDPRRRADAARWLARAPVHPSRQAEVARGLEAMLHTPHPGLRAAAAEALVTWATPDSVPALARVVKEPPAPGERWPAFALEALGRFKDPRAAEALVGHLASPFASDAYRALERMGPAAEPEVLRALNHPADPVRSGARVLLRSYRTGDDKLVRQSAADLREPARRVPAANWLAAAMPDDALRDEVTRGLEAMNGPGRELADPAVRALLVWGTKENVPAFLKVFGRPGDYAIETRGQVIAKLGALKDERALTFLIAALGNPPDSDAAVRALKEFGPPAEKALRQALDSSNPRVRMQAAYALKAIGAANVSDDLSFALADLKSDDRLRRREGLQKLARAPPDDKRRPEVAKALEACLEDPDRFVSGMAVQALARWASKESVPALIKLLKSDVVPTRFLVMRSLGELKDERAVGPLFERLREPHDRNFARSALLNLGPSPTLEKEAVKGLSDKDGEIRRECCRILEKNGTKGCLPALEKAAKEAAAAQNAGLENVARSAIQVIKARDK